MSRYPRLISLALLVVCFVLTGAVLPVAVGADTGGDLQQSGEWEPWANTTIQVEIQPDGDAVWRISTSIPVSDERDIEEFGNLAADFEDGEYPAPGLDLVQRAAEDVDGRTERPMDVTAISRGATNTSALEPGGDGELYVEFTWERFARVGEDRLHVDDVLVTTAGTLWLPSLQEGTTFIITGPEGYGVQANPGPDGTLEANQLRWEGPTSFEQSTLEATFIGTTQQPGDEPNGTDGEPPDDGDESGGMALWWLLIPVLLLGVAAVVVAVRMADVGVDLPAGTDDDSPVEATEAGESVDAATAEGTESEDDGIDTDLLSDEERVEHLLEQNGGRMKQATIVKETDWSDAKVSQLLSTMEEDGRINKLRIGRENLISFPDEDVTEIDE